MRIPFIKLNCLPYQSVCPSGWKEWRGSCYGYVPGLQSLAEARQFCEDREVSHIKYFKFFGCCDSSATSPRFSKSSASHVASYHLSMYIITCTIEYIVLKCPK